MAGDPTASEWCNLNWTEWQPLEAGFIRAFAPLSSGVYRVRRSGEAKRLTHVGQTGRTLRRRLMELANGTHAQQCPFNDPHTAAPYHWLISYLQGAQLQFSCTPVSGDHGTLRGTGDVLLWRHRVENKCKQRTVIVGIAERLHSAKIDVAIYLVCQTNRRNRQCQLCGQPPAPLQPMFSHGLTHRRLNLALSGDAELFEQLSDARVEDVLFHRAALRSLGYLSLVPPHGDYDSLSEGLG